MPSKQLHFRGEPRESIPKGAGGLADAVLGPKSKCVLAEKRLGRLIVCDNGKEVELKEPEESMGVQLVREAAERAFVALLLTEATLSEGREPKKSAPVISEMEGE